MGDVVRTFSSTGRMALEWLGRKRWKEHPSHPPAAVTGRRGHLARKYFLLIAGLVSLMLLLNGAVNLWFAYDENRTALFSIQQEKAESAARRISEFVAEIERQLGWT